MRGNAILAASTLLLALSLSTGAAFAQQNQQNRPQIDIWLQGSSCVSEDTRTGISNVERLEQQVNWRGVMEAPSPDHNLRYRVSSVSEVEEGLYRMNIEPVRPQDGQTQGCQGEIRYEGSFQADESFALELYHDGERVKVLRSENYQRTAIDQLRDGGGDIWQFFDNQARDFRDWTERTYPQLYDEEGIVRWN